MSDEKLIFVGEKSPGMTELADILAARGHRIVHAGCSEAEAAIDAEPASIRAVMLCFGGGTVTAEFEDLDRSARSRQVPMVSLINGSGSQPGFGYVVDMTGPDVVGPIEAILTESWVVRERTRELIEEVEHRTSAIGLIISGVFRFQTISQAVNLTTMLSRACPDPERVAIGLLELLVNAVEHGNLEIDGTLKEQLIRKGELAAEVSRRLAMYPDRYATIRFEKSKSAAVFHISDRGKGFDAAAYLNADLANNHGFSGRGILTAKALSFDRLEYIGNGSQVSAMISFPEGADDPSTAD